MNKNIIVAITKLNKIITNIDKDDTCFLDIKDTVEEVIALLKAKRQCLTERTFEMRINAMTETFENVVVLGCHMLFTPMRVDPDTVPKGLYIYEVRHDDDQQGDPVQIGKWILVNHWGTLITDTPIQLEQSPTGNAYRDIDPEEDWVYEGTSATVEEYMRKTKCKYCEHHASNGMCDFYNMKTDGDFYCQKRLVERGYLKYE